jgi:hypothetical protein
MFSGGACLENSALQLDPAQCVHDNRQDKNPGIGFVPSAGSSYEFLVDLARLILSSWISSLGGFLEHEMLPHDGGITRELASKSIERMGRFYRRDVITVVVVDYVTCKGRICVTLLVADRFCFHEEGRRKVQ